MLRISDLTVRFGETTVLNAIDLEVREGEFLALVGPSGSGKTTLLRTVAGFEEANRGTIRLRDQVIVQDRQSTPPERRHVGMVFQDYALFPHLSVRENVAFGVLRSREKKDIVERALASVEMSRWIDSMPHELSGGQQQRIALARALASEPRMILLDEPFSNLDPALRTQVRADVRRILRDAGVTAMLVTHDQEEALSIADRVAVLLHGEIAQIGTPREVYHTPNSKAVGSFVGDAEFLDGIVRSGGLETDLGIIPIAGSLPEGMKATAMIRPEMVMLKSETGSSAERLHVQHSEFFGRDQRVVLQHHSGSSIVARVPSETIYRPGEDVAVRFTHPAHVLPER
ncbi:MAG: ABC transporter ATP-binding protein [Thermomicrobiales bacterium]|nr:ABC transporter ATP-binding protein [Thermomicrobiales bacterium]MCO5228136.1 ABC transporter ATP-binding protein [Thermomicrobiales bacterium]